MRVYELARELKRKNEELLAQCARLGLAKNNRLSGLTDKEADKLREAFGSGSAKKRKPATPSSKSRAAKAKPPKDGGKPSNSGTAEATAKKKKKPRGTKEKPSTEERPPHGTARKKRRRGPIFSPEEVGDEEIRVTPLPDRYVPPSTIQRYRRRSGRRSRPKRASRVRPSPRGDVTYRVEVPISLKDFSAIVGIRANTLIMKLMQAGEMVTINAALSEDQVGFLASEFNLKVSVREAARAEDAVARVTEEADKPETLKLRPPVVAFLGHVDHGKTSLLDYIRKANVVADEHGGITQHIGAYKATLAGNEVVFLDTPGHEAFTTMRARGANVTDIVALVVAADDGVMPQTEEAIDHARAAGVPIVVALNKCDKPEANPNRVKQQLSQFGLQAEEWGGDTIVVEVSAITGKGVDELVEMLALVAELRELKANPDKSGRGAVLEAEISPTYGPVATVLVRDGTLRKGDVVVCGATYGRIKALLDDRGRDIPEAGPSTPVMAVGLNAPPNAGDAMVALSSLQQARAVAEERAQKIRQSSVARRQHVNLENFFDSLDHAETRELRIILKADVRGTLEALSQVLAGIKSEEVALRVLRSSVGGVSTSDVILADASDAVIIGLHVAADPAARALAEEKGVAVHLYNVIYRVKEEVERALVGLLAPEERETVMGHAEVRQIFRISRFGNIAGCYLTDGVIARNHRVRLIRDGVVIHDGRMASLRREKDDVREVREGFECGINLEGYDDVKTGDRIESYVVEKIARTLGGEGAS